jgi:hypothetical protein
MGPFVSLLLALYAASSGGAAERAFATQLHLHGPFSAAAGSVESHLAQAREAGVDVVWWSENDFRLAGYRHVTSFSFDGESEPIDRGEAWSASAPGERELSKALRARGRGIGKQQHRPGEETERAELTLERSRDGSSSLLLGQSGEGALNFRKSSRRFVAGRGLHQRPLSAGVRLRLAVLPLEVDLDGRGYVELQLSEHARGRHRVRYFLSNDTDRPWREGGTYFVPVPFRPGEWNELVLELTRDAVAGFEGAGRDNALLQLELGVEARAQARPTVQFDDLRIEVDAHGPEMLALQRELLDDVGRAFAGVRQYQGLELSCWSTHLTELGPTAVLPDYDRYLAESGYLSEEPGRLDEAGFRAYVAERAVREAHERGALVAYNHPFGVSDDARLEPAAVLAQLAQRRLHGADLLEVGYRERGGRTLAEHLWLWDRLAERGLFPVGLGASDSDGARREPRDAPLNNFVTWILAQSDERPDLLAGLARGRAWFGDPTRYDGTLDLTTARGFRMGQIVLTDREAVVVEVSLTGLEARDEVRVVEPSGPVAMLEANGAQLRREHPVQALPGFVRVELLGDDGEPRVLSNPIHFLREAPQGGIPPARAALDVGGVRSFSCRGFTLTGARAETIEGAPAVRIEGLGSGGELHLDLPLELTSARVDFEGLEGDFIDQGGNLVLTSLEGRGSILLRARTR